jgi:hypothetical protein
MMSYPNGVILVQISQQGCLSWPNLVSDWFNFEERAFCTWPQTRQNNQCE